MNIFRLKFAYKRNGDDGMVEKAKTEIFAECDTYSEAENVALEIIARDNMSKIDLCDYEVVKTKFTTKDFIDDNILGYDDELFAGKVEHYFSKEEEAFFVVNLKLITVDEKGKERRTPGICVVSSTSVNEAVVKVRNFMQKGMVDFIITSSKMDAAESLLLTPDSHKALMERG